MPTAESWAEQFSNLATARQIKGAEFIEMKDIEHFPMSENHPVFKKYLEQALEIVESRVGAPVG